jgi:hypothetical protein
VIGVKENIHNLARVFNNLQAQGVAINIKPAVANILKIDAPKNA